MSVLLTVTAVLHISSVVGQKVCGELYFWWVNNDMKCILLANNKWQFLTHNKTIDLNKRTKSVLDISILKEEWIALQTKLLYFG
jgi:hypothetical protein